MGENGGSIAVAILAVIALVIVVGLQIMWANECAALGGDYVRLWNGWPSCVGVE